MTPVDPPGTRLSSRGATLFYGKILPWAMGAATAAFAVGVIEALVRGDTGRGLLIFIWTGWVVFFAVLYRFASRFCDVWLNGDRLEVRHGLRVESVPLTEVREVEFTRYARSYPWATLHIAIGARTARVMRFFPIDATGFFRYQSAIVDELRTLTRAARARSASLPSAGTD